MTEQGFIVPLLITVCCELGALAMMLYRWSESKEPFDWRKFLHTGVYTLMTALFGAMVLVSEAQELSDVSLFFFCVLAIRAGWGDVYSFSQASKVRATQEPPDPPRD